jgi:hypothetical protein
VKKRTKVEKGTKQLGNKSKKEGSIEQTRKWKEDTNDKTEWTKGGWEKTDLSFSYSTKHWKDREREREVPRVEETGN